MTDVVRFASASDYASYTSPVAGVPTDETDAIVVLDTDVLATSTASVGGNTQATLFINYTPGSLTDVLIDIYTSPLGNPTSADWFRETVESFSTPNISLDSYNIKLTIAKKQTYHFPIGAARAMKITVQGEGTKTGSAITLYLGLRSN